MTGTRQIPTALSVTSYAFFVLGILALIGIIVNATRNSFILDFNILGFWICAGLRRYSQGWRTCALVYICLTMIACAFGVLYGFVDHGPVCVKILGKQYKDIPVTWVSIFSAVYFFLTFWTYRVLTRPSIRSMFYGESQTPAA
jgi:hypothetical protein